MVQMNANELADLLDFDAKTLNWKAFADAATMLRQQANQIEALKQIIDANNLNQNIGQFVKPAKTLTDEEMISIYEKDWSGIKCGLGRAVEQAILRKAQEK
jgi:hypothetical protein